MNERIKKAYALREALNDSTGRRYLATELARNTTKKLYTKTLWEDVAYRYAVGLVGMESDAFLLYAIMHLGAARLDTIVTFLKAMKRKNPELSISCEDREAVASRIRELFKCGLVFKFTHEFKSSAGEENDICSIYSITENGASLCKAKLSVNLPYNNQFIFKQYKEILGWASAAEVTTRVALESDFVTYLERREKTAQLGIFYLSGELLCRKDETDYYIGFMPSYLGQNKAIHTKYDYDAVCAYKVDMIRNYLNCKIRNGMAGIPIIVVSFENNADLNEFARCIHNSGVMAKLYPNIYFTGEGVLNKGIALKDSFMQMVADEENEKGYIFCQAEPTFL